MNESVNASISTNTDTKGPTSPPTQLLTTKFYVPVTPGVLIARPRLSALLEKCLEHPFTLVSAPAGFGKTTLLSTWVQSLQARHTLVAWLSLDEEDNDPQTFWTYVISALDAQQLHHFTSLLEALQSPHALSLKSLLVALINRLAESTKHVVLILDDYQVIVQEQIHSMVAYLLERLPAQLHIIVCTRADPPLPLPMLRARKQALEVRTEQLRCTREETSAFFQEVMGIQLSERIIRDITARTEGWLVGLHLLGLTLPDQANPVALLQEICGSQRYILDYLTEVVLRRQPQEVQTFLLCTSILEQLNTSLCDAVMQHTSSHQMLKQLEQSNLFVVSLDSKREWYRYHALFAEALHYQLEQLHADLLPVLHHRASVWYAEHDHATQAILHAFNAHEWQWAADLIERKSEQLLAFTWGPSSHHVAQFQYWLKQLPAEVMDSRPRLCLAYTHLLWTVAPYNMLNRWFETVEAHLTALLTPQAPGDTSQAILPPQAQQEQKDLLGEALAWRAYLHATWEDHGPSALELCQQALSLLSADNVIARAYVALAQLQAYYTSSANDAVLAAESGRQGVRLAQMAKQPALTILLLSLTALYMIGAGRLHEAKQLTQQAMQSGGWGAGLALPEVGFPAAIYAEILREWNQLEAAHALIGEAISLSEQAASPAALFRGYTMLLRISLSCGDLEMARSAHQHIEDISGSWNQPMSLQFRSHYTIMDQVRLWLACGEVDCALHWVEMLGTVEYHGTPLVQEREEVARVCVLLTRDQPALGLQRLELVLQRASQGQRWGHVIEIRLLQALAHQMLHDIPQALVALSEAVRLAEPEGYLRSFVDEGPPMRALLSLLREQQHKAGPTSYLDTLLVAFQEQSKAQGGRLDQTGEHTKMQPLLDPLSEREMQVLQLLAQGASNQEIAHELIIARDTVKRHISHIFSKLGVNNRVQAVKQARAYDLLSEQS